MKIVIAPDSFKGSLSSIQVGSLVKEAFLQEFPEAVIDVVPMADGGEGTMEALIFATDGYRVEVEATGPLGEPIRTSYGVLGDHKTAVVEIAAIAGLPMVPLDQRNPMLTTTYGMGEVIRQALDQGYRQFIIGLGGSATNDAGLGMLQALGAVFADEHGQAVPPVGASLSRVKTVDYTALDPRLKECQFQIASDVTNPLCGKLGASRVFALQKGATEEQAEWMDQAMQHAASLIEGHLGAEFQEQPGAGAAGGLGFAFLTLGGRLISGAQIVANASGLKEKLKRCDWVITGEGRSDYQTAFGKVPYFVGKMAKQLNKRAILLSGSLGEGAEQLHEVFVSLHSIAPGPVSLEDSMKHGSLYMKRAAANIARLIKAASGQEHSNPHSIH